MINTVLEGQVSQNVEDDLPDKKTRVLLPDVLGMSKTYPPICRQRHDLQIKYMYIHQIRRFVCLSSHQHPCIVGVRVE